MSDPPSKLRALITGASSGIGRAFAERYAEEGVDIVAVARRAGPLEELAHSLKARHNVEVTILPGDLADAETPEALAAALDSRGLDIDILVNNAGFGVPGNLCDVDWQRHRDTLEVMTCAPVRLCYLLAPPMFRRGFGRIVNISSLSAILPPHAGGTLYYPVKSFLYQFSLAFRAEMAPGGVHVTAVCPGFTETNFQNAAGGTVESVAVPHWLWTTPDQVARVGISAVAANRPVVIPGLFNKATAAFFKYAPTAIGRWIVK